MGRSNYVAWAVAFSSCVVGCGQDAPPMPQQQPGFPVMPAPAAPFGVPSQPLAGPFGAPGAVPPVGLPGMPSTAPVTPIIAPITPIIPVIPVPPTTTLIPGQVVGPQVAVASPGANPPVVPSIPPPPSGADPRAAERMREYTVQMMATGYMPFGAPGADTLGRHGSRNFGITMSGGDCYTIAGFGGAGVRDLDAYLYSPTGRQLVRDFATDSRPIVRSCATETGEYRVRFHMYAGAGPYTYQVYRSAGAAVQAEGLAGLDSVVRRRLELFTASRLAKGYRPVQGMSGAGVLSTNGRQSFTANLDAGRCYVIAGFGGSGVSDLDIYLNAPAGNQVARDVATDPSPDVRHCPNISGPYRITVLMYRGNGPWAYQAYRDGS